MIRKAERPDIQSILVWIVPIAFLVYFFYQPLAAIFRLVFSPAFSQGWKNFELSQISKPFFFTIYQATLSTVLTLIVGLPAAYVFARFDFWGRKNLRLLSMVPFILPTVVVAAAFNTLVGPRGWLNLGLMSLFNLDRPPLDLLNSLPAILLAHVFYNSSILIRMVGSSLSRLNPRLTDAARMLSASPSRAMMDVTLPLLMPTLAGATLMVFLFDFTSFGVIMMLGGPRFATMEVEIYTQAMQYLNLPVAGLLTVIQLVFTLAITWLYNRLKQPNYGKSAPSAETHFLRKPKKRKEKSLIIVVAIFIFCLVALPLLSLASRSVFTLDAARGERGVVQMGFTLRYYQELFVNRAGSLFYVPPMLAIRNSLLYSGLATVIAIIVGLLAAYALAQTSRLSRLAEPLIMLPLGASSVTLGLGFLIVFNHPPWNTPSFPLLIPIAHALVALPLVLRNLVPALRAIPPSLRESASVLGASHTRVILEVDLPLIWRAILVSMVFAFSISLGEFGAATFLVSPQQPTIPVAIYRYISQPGAVNYGQALAMATILMLICILCTIMIEKIHLPGEELY